MGSGEVWLVFHLVRGTLLRLLVSTPIEGTFIGICDGGTGQENAVRNANCS